MEEKREIQVCNNLYFDLADDKLVVWLDILMAGSATFGIAAVVSTTIGASGDLFGNTPFSS